MSHLKICVTSFYRKKSDYNKLTDDSSLLNILLNLKVKYGNDIKKYNESIQNGKTHVNSGFDLYVPESMLTKVGETSTIKHMIKCAVYDDNGNPLPYYLFPRSSISKTQFRMANSVGIIDSGYRGEIMAKVDVVNGERNTPVLEQGDRLFQICSHNLLPFKSIELVSELDETDRGEGGFGSTGR